MGKLVKLPAIRVFGIRIAFPGYEVRLTRSDAKSLAEAMRDVLEGARQSAAAGFILTAEMVTSVGSAHRRWVCKLEHGGRNLLVPSRASLAAAASTLAANANRMEVVRAA